MTLLRASLITGVATVVRMAAGLMLDKIFALYVGRLAWGTVHKWAASRASLLALPPAA